MDNIVQAGWGSISKLCLPYTALYTYLEPHLMLVEQGTIHDIWVFIELAWIKGEFRMMNNGSLCNAIVMLGLSAWLKVTMVHGSNISFTVKEKHFIMNLLIPSINSTINNYIRRLTKLMEVHSISFFWFGDLQESS